MTRLYAVAKTEKSAKQHAREAVQQHREKAIISGGLFIGERFNHRGWPPEVVMAFLNAPIILPAQGDVQRELYGGSLRKLTSDDSDDE